MRQDQIVWEAHAILKLKRDSYWIAVDKTEILESKRESIRRCAELRRGVKLDVEPWERATSSGSGTAIACWLMADVIYEWWNNNWHIPDDQMWRVCYNEIGMPRSNTWRTIINYIEERGDPRWSNRYNTWYSTAITNDLSSTLSIGQPLEQKDCT